MSDIKFPPMVTTPNACPVGGADAGCVTCEYKAATSTPSSGLDWKRAAKAYREASKDWEHIAELRRRTEVDLRAENERLRVEIASANTRTFAVELEAGRLRTDVESWKDMVGRMSVELAQVRAENERLKAEIKEARNEAATVRRAYMHEKARAEAAGAPEETAYKGQADWGRR